MEYKELFDRIYKIAKKEISLDKMCELLELKDYEVLGLISLMKENGYIIDYIDGKIVQTQNDLANKEGFFIPKDKTHIKFLAIFNSLKELAFKLNKNKNSKKIFFICSTELPH